MTTIRQFKDSDAPQMTAIYLRAVTELGKLRYHPEQVAVWAKLTPDADRLTELMNDGRNGFVAVTSDDTVVAFGDLEADGHIQFLYADPGPASSPPCMTRSKPRPPPTTLARCIARPANLPKASC